MSPPLAPSAHFLGDHGGHDGARATRETRAAVHQHGRCYSPANSYVADRRRVSRAHPARVGVGLGVGEGVGVGVGHGAREYRERAVEDLVRVVYELVGVRACRQWAVRAGCRSGVAGVYDAGIQLDAATAIG